MDTITNMIRLLINIYWDEEINNDQFESINDSLSGEIAKDEQKKQNVHTNDVDVFNEVCNGGIDLDKIFTIIPELKNSLVIIRYIKNFQKIFNDTLPPNMKKSINNKIQSIIIDSRHNSYLYGKNENDKEENKFKDNEQYDIFRNGDTQKKLQKHFQ